MAKVCRQDRAGDRGPEAGVEIEHLKILQTENKSKTSYPGLWALPCARAIFFGYSRFLCLFFSFRFQWELTVVYVIFFFFLASRFCCIYNTFPSCIHRYTSEVYFQSNGDGRDSTNSAPLLDKLELNIASPDTMN